MPTADPHIRAALEQEAQALGWPALHAQLALVDPATAARLAPADSQRIGRALEVWRSAGVPLSQLQLRSQQADADGLLTKGQANPQAPLISLEPQDRSWLHARIAERFDAILANGLVQEVQSLRARGDLHAALASMRCVGYRQVWEVLDGNSPAAQLRDIGDQLVDIHGQHAWQSLTKPSAVRGLLDAYAGVDSRSLQLAWDDWRSAQNTLVHARQAQNQLQQEREPRQS
jgi:tRNA A37 N6-isopentenylltransferase MiaA